MAPAPPARAAFTTVANWNAYGGITHEGEHFGQKNEEFLRVLALPSRSGAALEIAISGADDATQARLSAAGWRLRPAANVSATLGSYRDYITGSRGEFSNAKNAYVKSRSGWFSDRSACYLAAGLPVVVQDTGVSMSVPGNEGLLTFSTLDEAAAALEDAERRHEAHRAAAFELARTYFDHRQVLQRLLARVGRAAASP